MHLCVDKLVNNLNLIKILGRDDFLGAGKRSCVLMTVRRHRFLYVKLGFVFSSYNI